MQMLKMYLGFELAGDIFDLSASRSISTNKYKISELREGSGTYYIICGEFESEQEAEKFNQLLCCAIMISASDGNFGVNIDRAAEFNSAGLKEWSQRFGRPVFKGGTGTTIYLAESQPLFGTFSVGKARPSGVYVTRSASAFLDRLEVYINKIDPESLPVVAVELVNSHFSEKSDLTKFLVLMSAIESLSNQHSEEMVSVENIRKLKAFAKSLSVNAKGIDKINQKISEVNKESISQSFQRLCARHLNLENSRSIEIYRARSKILHEGKVPSSHQLREHRSTCLQLARAMIAETLGLDEAATKR